MTKGGTVTSYQHRIFATNSCEPAFWWSYAVPKPSLFKLKSTLLKAFFIIATTISRNKTCIQEFELSVTVQTLWLKFYMITYRDVGQRKKDDYMTMNQQISYE